MKIVFDTETSGLPDRLGWDRYFPPEETKHYDNSRLVQLGYIVIDDNNEEVKRFSAIVKPEGFRIENERFHNISHAKACREGLEITEVLKAFYDDFKDCSLLIAHNISFDINIVQSEMYRSGLLETVTNFRAKNLYCTMNEGRRLLGLYKAPKLVELFYELYKRGWNQVHDALDDAECALLCYKKLVVTFSKIDFA